VTFEETRQDQQRRPSNELRWLTPETTELSESEFLRLQCTVRDEETEVYDDVRAVLLFPVRHARRYIALRNTGLTGPLGEIGVINRLSAFPPAQQALIEERLQKQYYEQIIERIYRIETGHGQLFFDVETQRGREQFVMPWRSSATQAYGERGKVLLEALGNRYILPDVDTLPRQDRRRFIDVIYW
jgi:hypothetical protein